MAMGEVSNKDIRCGNCGGRRTYSPKDGALRCENCGSMVKIPTTVAQGQDFLTASAMKNNWGKEAHSVKCQSCGAIEVLSMGDLADVCPFCSSPNIIDSGTHNAMKPTGLMPFMIDKEAALRNVYNTVRKNFWAPRNFKRNFAIDDLKPLYTPCWTFDASMVGTYRGRLGKAYTRSVVNNDGSSSTITEIRWFNVSGNINKFYDDILIEAGQMISGTTLAKLEPYNTNTSIQYNSLFLSGYTANQYSKDINAAYNQAESVMKNKMNDLIVSQYNADRVEFLDLAVRFDNVTYKYLLLPVYSKSVHYQNKNYNIFVNGTTGKVAAKLPVSKGKVWAFVLGVLAIAAAIVGAIAYFG